MLQWYGSGKLKTIMNLQREQLLGTWLLQRWQVEYSDARPSSYPFGTDAIGVLIYAPDGWMSATMVSGASSWQKWPAEGSVTIGPDGKRARKSAI